MHPSSKQELFNALDYKDWRRMKVKEKIFVGGIVVGVMGVFVIPDNACADVGETFCGIAPIIGYVGFGLAGLIVCIKLLYILRQLCICCCDSFMSRFRGHRREPLLRDNFYRSYRESEGSGEAEEQYQYGQQEEEEPYQVPPIQEPFFNDFEPVRQSFNQKECSICLDEFKKDDVIDRQRCNHKFHAVCIRDWLQKNPNCPICRLQLR